MLSKNSEKARFLTDFFLRRIPVRENFCVGTPETVFDEYIVCTLKEFPQKTVYIFFL